jgi:ubiquinone/menaquinone biosynthesis C-methylase UbiE
MTGLAATMSAMDDGSRPRKMPDWEFRGMAWLFRLVDIFSGPEKKLARLPLRRGMTVVDYACGPGRYTEPVARFVGPEGKVYAVDIQPLALSMVRDRANRAALANIETVFVQAYDTGIPSACTDLVLLLDAFHGIGDRLTLLREIHRLIKPDGLFLMEPGHMDGARARAIVTETGLFRHLKTIKKDMHFSPLPPS